jgi:TonB family protein
VFAAPFVFVGLVVGRLVFAGLGLLWRCVERRLPARVRTFCASANAYVSREDRPMWRFLAISGVLHLVCFLLAGTLPASSRDPRWQAAPMVVSLVALPEPGVTPRAGQKAQPPHERPPEQRPKIEEKPKEKVPTIRERKPAKTESKPTPTPRETAPTPWSPTSQQGQSDSLESQPSSSVNLQMAGRVDESSFSFDYYLPQVVSLISASWQQPAGISGQGEGPAATIRFRIRRNGAVTELAVEDPSRVALFDLSAQQAVMSAQPLPPLPPAYGGEWLTIHLRFIYTDPRPAGLRGH